MQLDNEIRRKAEHILAKHYEHLHVEVGGARLVQGRGIRLYDVQIEMPIPGSAAQPLLHVDEALLVCNTQLDDLVAGRLQAERLVVKRPTLRAQHLADGSWNLSKLWPPPSLGKRPPAVDVEAATVFTQLDPAQDQPPLAIRGVDLTLTPIVDATAPSERRYTMAATIRGAPAREIRLEGEVAPGAGGLRLRADVRDLKISPELLASLWQGAPGPLADWQLHALASGHATIARPVGTATAPEWTCQFELSAGRLTHPLLPAPVTDFTCRGRGDTERCLVEHFAGKMGSANIVLACDRAGWETAAPFALRAEVKNLTVDRQLKSQFPPAAMDVCKRFDPSGRIDADLQLQFDGVHWWPDVTVACHDATLTDNRHFPYRLRQTSGTVRYSRTPGSTNDRLQLDLTGDGRGRPVRVRADLAGIAQRQTEGQPPIGFVEVAGAQIPIHDQLVAALPGDAQNVVRALNPAGRVDFRWRTDRRDPRAASAKSLDLTLADCSIRYAEFPYPIRDIVGRVTCRNNVWKLDQVSGRGSQESAVVTVQGVSQPVADGRTLTLNITGAQIPLDEKLHQALQPELQHAWRELGPRGRVDFSAQVVHHSQGDASARPTVSVSVTPHADTVSLEPAFLPQPYRLEQLQGNFVLADGRVTMTGLRARHGRVAAAADGIWQTTPGGGWQLTFDQLHVDHLRAQRDLLTALPLRLQKAVEQLQPQGSFSIYDSRLELTRDADKLAAIRSNWRVNLACHQAELKCGVPLSGVSGTLQLAGNNSGPVGYTAGELHLDSVIWNNLQFTNVRGPLWVEQTPTGSICLLGREAARKQRQPPRDLMANVYGGALVANIHTWHEGHPQFQLSASLAGAELSRIARERLGTATGATGTVGGRLRLAGTGSSKDAVTGSGELHIVDANIYKLPRLVALLKALQNRMPDTTAFNQVDAQFDIQGRHVHLEQLNLLGDVVSLYGRGDSTLQGDNLNLVFHALVGRTRVPVLSALMGQASEQTLQLRVDGSLENPQFHREALPAVRKTLEQIQAELQPVTDAGARAANSSFPFWPFRK